MKITSYMAEQPRTIVEGFTQGGRRLRELGINGTGSLTLVGSGSSLNACLFAENLLRDAEVVPPVDFLERSTEAGGTVVVLTQSGASTTSIAVARKASKAGARVVVVTANEQSAAAGLGVPVILLPIGEEPIGPKTKGYTSSCALLLALAAFRGASVDAPDAAALELALELGWTRARTLAPALDQLDYVLVSGAGAGYGTALEGSLKIAEIAGVPTAAFSMEETLHGRLHGATRHSLCLPITSSDTTAAQAERISAAMGRHSVQVEPVEAVEHAGLPEPWNILGATFFFQALAVELCRRRGGEPDLMRYPGLSRHLDIKTDACL